MEYQTVEGTSYHKETSEEVIAVLNSAIVKRNRLRFWYGKDGQSWDEENDVCGYIGRSTGNNKIPLLIHSRRSYGGGALLDNCIVKIVDTKTKRTLYIHPQFKQGNFIVNGSSVLRNNETYANCKNELSAKRLADFMNGFRFNK